MTFEQDIVKVCDKHITKEGWHEISFYFYKSDNYCAFENVKVSKNEL